MKNNKQIIENKVNELRIKFENSAISIEQYPSGHYFVKCIAPPKKYHHKGISYCLTSFYDVENLSVEEIATGINDHFFIKFREYAI